MRYELYELQSARSPGWYQIDCNWCDWYTTGWESVCEEAWWDHADQVHPRRVRMVY